MSNAAFAQSLLGTPTLGVALQTTAANYKLDSAYTFNSAGDAMAIRFVAPKTVTLTDVYIFCDAITGTPSTMRVELRNYAGLALPGGTLHASTTASWPASSSKWVKATFGSPYTLTVGETYFLIVADAAGGAVNYASPLYRGAINANDRLYYLAETVTSANGFFTAGSAASCVPGFVLKFGDGTYWGQPFTDNLNYTSNTRERGFLLTPDCDMLLKGVVFTQASQINGFKVYPAASAPGGTALATISFGGVAGAAGAALWSPQLLQRGYQYRCVFTFGSASTAPVYWVIEDYASFPEVAGAVTGDGAIQGTIDNGAGGWTDSPDQLPRATLLLSAVRGKPRNRRAA